MPVVELVKWKSAANVEDAEMVDAVAAILPDLQSLPGFKEQRLYQDDDGCWVDVYIWESRAEALASNDLMADKPAFTHLIGLIEEGSIRIEFLTPAE